MHREPTLRQYLFNRIIYRKGSLESDCWIWKYDKFYYAGSRHSARIASYEEFIGPVPEGRNLKLKCINPKCINPEHLTLNTAPDVFDEDDWDNKPNVESSNKLLEALLRYH